MSDDLNHYVPSRLDDPEKFLFFRKDVAMLGMAVSWAASCSGMR